jgi:hypothetical protein
MTHDPTYLLLLGSLGAGLAWGRISPRLPIPEWLRLLTTPLWTGCLFVSAMLCASIVMRSWTSPRIVEVAALGLGPLARLATGYLCLWFLAGAALGLPATIGWAIAYPQRGKGDAARGG